MARTMLHFDGGGIHATITPSSGREHRGGESRWLTATHPIISPPQQGLRVLEGGCRTTTPDETTLFYRLLRLRLSCHDHTMHTVIIWMHFVYMIHQYSGSDAIKYCCMYVYYDSSTAAVVRTRARSERGDGRHAAAISQDRVVHLASPS